MSDLTDKIVVVIGATSGIGARAAELAAQEGATVIVAGRRRAEGEAVVARLPRAGQYLPVDVRDEH